MSLLTNLGHVGIICDDLMKVRDFYNRVMGLTVTDENLELGICFLSADPENHVGEVYYKTGVVKQGFSRAVDLDSQTDREILDFSQSFEVPEGPFQGAKLPVGGDD